MKMEGWFGKRRKRIRLGISGATGIRWLNRFPLYLVLQKEKDGVSIFALDETGHRKKELPGQIRSEKDGIGFDLMKESPYLWYEIVFSKTSIRNAGIY